MITSQMRRRKLKEVVAYVKDFRLLKHFEPMVIEKVWESMTKTNYIRG